MEMDVGHQLGADGNDVSGDEGVWPTASLRGGISMDAIAVRIVDLIVAAVLLVVLLPVIALTAVAVKFDSRGSVFFRCRRFGFQGAEFRMLKFRKMRDGVSGAALTLSDDSRFTTVGRVLAKTKIDELPQLWNVLKGEMTLVGPRPEDPAFVHLRRTDYTTILTVKPGITGFSQLAFAKEGEILDDEDCIADYVARLLPQKVGLDLLYVRHRSLALNLRILLWTAVPVLLRQDVAVHRSTGRLCVRRRPSRQAHPAAPTPDVGLNR
jgi:lipopolysaccharide/colanic/teichoic acid biosynthesis glycosyltransferase